MNKFKEWAKRPVNITFLIFMLITAAILTFALASLFSKEDLTKLLNKLKDMINIARSDGEMHDAEGYAVIFGSIIYRIVSFGNTLVKVFTVYIPIAVALLISSQAVFSRLIYSPTSEGRLVCYRIITGICCATTAASFIFYTLFAFIEPVAGIIMLAVDVLIIAAIVICIRNTYTNRIKL